MSRVYFHSPSGEAELRGSERAWGSSVVDDIAIGLVTPTWGEQVDRMLELVPPAHYLHMANRDAGWLQSWESLFRTAWRVEMGAPLLSWKGQPLSAWTFSLNTAIALGNDQVRFLARLHGQCEIHGWVNGPHRAWLAGIIDHGRAIGLYRPTQGWEEVATLLRTRDDEPVVMSYSVCDSFPNSSIAGWHEEDDPDGDRWYELSTEEQWERAMKGLRADTGLHELQPEGFADFRFGHELTVLDLLAPDRDERLDAAVAAGARDDFR